MTRERTARAFGRRAIAAGVATALAALVGGLVLAPPAHAGPPTTLTVQARHIDSADHIEVSGTLTVDGGPRQYETITVAVRPAGTATWNDVGYGYTEVDGTWQDTVAIASAGTYEVQARHEANGDQTSYAVAVTTISTRAAVVRASVSQRSVRFGRYVQVEGTVRFGGGDIPNEYEPVRLQRRRSGSATWSTVKTEYMWDGDVSAQVVAKGSAEYRWYFPGAGIGLGAAGSAPIAVAVGKNVTAVVSPTRVTPGSKVTVTVTVRPRKGTAAVQRRNGAAWTSLSSGAVPGTGRRTFTVKVRRAGTFTYRATSNRVSTADGTVHASATAAVTVTSTLKGLGKARSYTFLHRYNGKPVRWNPCQVITYKVNVKYASAGALADTKEALRRITQVNGLRFGYRGTTSWMPFRDRSRQPAELVIGFAPPKVVNYAVGGYVAGRGGPTMRFSGGRAESVSGMAVVSTKAGLTPGFGRGATRGLVLMHELAHVVGLDHTGGRHQIMRASGGLPNAVFGAGDIRGLRKLGRSQGCL